MPKTTRVGLERAVTFLPSRSDDEGLDDGLTLRGYAAVFDQETEINSWEGYFTETISRGAFRKTIRENTPVLQFDHGRHPLVGSIPIGVIESLSEDEEGLYVEARLSDNWLIEPVRHAIKDRAVKGMSFRFEVIRDEWRDNADKLVKEDELASLLWNPGERGPLKRTLKELRVQELGPVVFPAYAGTSVDVRANEAAIQISRDADLVKSIRSSLALGRDIPDETGLRKEVAAALLFRDLPVTTDHTSTEETKEVVEEVPSTVEGDVVRSDAPLSNEHPSSEEIIRLNPDRVIRDANYRREYLSLIMRGNRYAGDS